jgi:hypothetical protein
MTASAQILGRIACSSSIEIMKKSPVQPFFELLRSLMTNEPSGGVTLWQVCAETLGRDYYFTQDGRLSLSKRWAESQRYFGDLFSSMAQIHSSFFYQELQALIGQNAPISPQCPDCRAAGFCAGFLRALDTTQNCVPFISLYEIMAAHTPALKSCLAGLPATKQREAAESIANQAQPVAIRGNTHRAPGPWPTLWPLPNRPASKKQ